MGWKNTTRTYRIKFPENHEFHGLEFKVDGLTIKEYIEYQRSPEATILNEFYKRVISTTAEDEDGNPIPVTVEGLQTIDASAMVTSAIAWMRKAGGIVRTTSKLNLPVENTEDDGGDPLEGMTMDQV